MYQKTIRAGISGLSIFLLGASLSLAAPQDPAKPDNTKVNQRDRMAREPTADQQKENTSDRQLTAKIRRAIMADKSLSTYAHNVKIIVQNGDVTLKGPVHTEDEKKAVEAKATEAAGSAKVTNELSVKGDTTHAKKTKTT